eukprot:5773320-Amphidinium_carterae.1
MEGDRQQHLSEKVRSQDPEYVDDFEQWQVNKLRKLENQQNEIIQQQHVLQEQEEQQQKQLQQQYDQHSEYQRILLQVLERLPPKCKQPNVPEPEETPDEVTARPATTPSPTPLVQKPSVPKVVAPPMQQQSVDPAKASTTRRVVGDPTRRRVVGSTRKKQGRT